VASGLSFADLTDSSGLGSLHGGDTICSGAFVGEGISWEGLLGIPQSLFIAQAGLEAKINVGLDAVLQMVEARQDITGNFGSRLARRRGRTMNEARGIEIDAPAGHGVHKGETRGENLGEGKLGANWARL
jgi:hypothetical protein